MTGNGESRPTTPGTEQYEVFDIYFHYQSRRDAYDYRHTDRELFSCVAPTLTECRRKRDEWLNKKVATNLKYN